MTPKIKRLLTFALASYAIGLVLGQTWRDLDDAENTRSTARRLDLMVGRHEMALAHIVNHLEHIEPKGDPHE